MKRPESPDNDLPLLLGSWSLELGPVQLSCLNSDAVLHAGYLAVEISGMGYLYPWTFQELVDRAEQHPKIRELMALCRKTWPVPKEKPDQRIEELRKQYKELWPYPRTDLEWDWYWGLAETG